jgi:LPS-assembly lipoprotein
MPAFAGMTGFCLTALLALSGCGFAPLYGGGGAADVARQMDEVQVADIPERPGQMLRLSLQDQLQLAGAPVVQRYVLTVNYGIVSQGIGIQQDTASTRNRFVADASWTLSPIGDPAAKLASGQASTEDAENVIDQQYFAVTLETDTINQQLADEIAGQIAQQVAVYFKTHPAG